MPPLTLFDWSGVDLDKVLFDQEAVRATNPQRGDMEMLNAIVHADPEAGTIIGYKDCRADEFWVPGHIPGRPLFPGVLMLEAAAQVASFFTRKYVIPEGFIGFGAADGIKFRGQVVPGDRLYIAVRKNWFRHRRVHSNAQGWVKGNLVFEAEIVGVQF
jgi:3-hydroxyacyl-[acyl-carrier-protein] dehydratase